MPYQITPEENSLAQMYIEILQQKAIKKQSKRESQPINTADVSICQKKELLKGGNYSHRCCITIRQKEVLPFKYAVLMPVEKALYILFTNDYDENYCYKLSRKNKDSKSAYIKVSGEGAKLLDEFSGDYELRKAYAKKNIYVCRKDTANE